MTTPARYRVWCLSWEDTEENGSDVVARNSLAQLDFAREERGVVYGIIFDASDAAEVYADYAHGNRDGWESSWPLAFRVRCPDGSTQDFEVDRESVPEFTASPVTRGSK